MPYQPVSRGKGEKDHGHHGKELHQLILLDGQLGLVGLPHMTDDVLEIAHRPQVTVHSAAQNHHASADRPGERSWFSLAASSSKMAESCS